MRVGIVAPASVVGQVELGLGIEHLTAAGFDVVRHPQCARQHFTFAGTDEERAAAIWEVANDPSIDVLWSARGGYGAVRLLPMLEALTKERGAPAKKLLAGYSDITVLHEFVRKHWDWSTLHAAMPASDLSVIKPDEWRATVELVKRKHAPLPYEASCLKFMNDAPVKPQAAEVVGGNLSLWASLVGTPWQPDARRKFLFLEDLGEPYYRIDRMFTQVVQSGGLDGAAGLILGDFTDCKDESNTALRAPENEDERERIRRDRKSASRIPLRKVYDEQEAFDNIFGAVGKRLGVPVAYGLPVGHGPNFAPLPLGAKYQLTPDGGLQLLEWDWLA
jgi:muramoyltetrapeptide carboxypeptidase